MKPYSEEVLQTFLRKQGQLFDEPVAFTIEDADYFLEESMAVVLDSVEEVLDYFEESGYDISEMAPEDILDTPEVFPLPSGKFLIIEG